MQERVIKVIPGLLFLFCVLSLLELCLIIEDMNKAEKLEAEIRSNLKGLEHATMLLNKHLEGMQLEYFKDKNIKIK
ncbi:hypothetical protein ACR9LS_07530 [Helicobacter pylori]